MTGTTGQFQLNQADFLAIHELKYALKTAIARGLQLAIFNSCEGLGLARELADLQIPQLIVMREPVPDQVAQTFLRFFLQSFSQNKPLYLSVREAQERLEGLEKDFPCASWLPIICQNPAVPPPTWQALCQGVERRKFPRDDVVTMVFTDLVNSTAVKKFLEGRTLEIRNHHYLDTILNPHRQRIEADLTGYRGRLIRTEGDACFLVFANAVLAARWAAQVQRSHEEKPISTPLGPLKVRIGMHTGSPLHDGPDFIGQEVDYAARVSALACGGQILMSEATATLIRNTPIDGYRLMPYGDFDLKGIGTVPVAELGRHPEVGGQVPARPPQGKTTENYWRRFNTSLAGGLICALGVMALRYGGLLQKLELKAFDQLLRWRPVEQVDTRFLVVEVTEADIQAQTTEGRYGSLSDQALLQLLETLQASRPRVIGLDILRDHPVSPNLPQLKTWLQSSNTLFAVCKMHDAAAQAPEVAPPPEVAADFLGFSDTLTDADGIVRRHLLGMTPEAGLCTTAYSLSVQLAAAYLEQAGIQLQFTESGQWQWGSRTFRPMEPHWGGYQKLDVRGHQIMLNYRYRDSPKDTFPTVTLSQVLNGKVREEFIRDRIILIGTTAPSYRDYSLTPYQTSQGSPYSIPGVFLQAQMTSQLLSYGLSQRPLIGVWPLWGEGLWITVWAWIGSSLAVAVKRLPLLVFLLGLTLTCLSLVCWLLLLYWGSWVPWVPGVLAILISSGSTRMISNQFPSLEGQPTITQTPLKSDLVKKGL